jgi:hypothetical protein
VKRINPDTILDLKVALAAAWALTQQTSIDRLCQRFQLRLKLCFIEEGDSISNQLWRISEGTAVKDFLEGNRVYVQWTEEDRRLLADRLNIGPRWKFLAKRSEDRSVGQLKNH